MLLGNKSLHCSFFLSTYRDPCTLAG